MLPSCLNRSSTTDACGLPQATGYKPVPQPWSTADYRQAASATVAEYASYGRTLVPQRCIRADHPYSIWPMTVTCFSTLAALGADPNGSWAPVVLLLIIAI